MLPLKNAGNIDVQLKLKVILTFTFLIRSGVWVSLCDILGSDCGTYCGDSLIFCSCFSCFLHFYSLPGLLSLTLLTRSLSNFVFCYSSPNFLFFFSFPVIFLLSSLLHILYSISPSISFPFLHPGNQLTNSLYFVPTFAVFFSLLFPLFLFIA